MRFLLCVANVSGNRGCHGAKFGVAAPQLVYRLAESTVGPRSMILVQTDFARRSCINRVYSKNRVAKTRSSQVLEMNVLTIVR